MRLPPRPGGGSEPHVTAGSFRELVTIAKQVGTDDAVSAKQLAAVERLRADDLRCCWNISTSRYGSRSCSIAPKRRRPRAKAASSIRFP